MLAPVAVGGDMAGGISEAPPGQQQHGSVNQARAHCKSASKGHDMSRRALTRFPNARVYLAAY